MRQFLRIAMVCVVLTVSACAQKTYPEAVRQQIENARNLCEQISGHFSFDSGSLKSADLNTDRRDDYVLSSAGFLCDGAVSLYAGSAGFTYYLYLSDKNGILIHQKEDIISQFMDIDNSTTPATITFKGTTKDGAFQQYETRWGWRNGKMSLIATKITPVKDN